MNKTRFSVRDGDRGTVIDLDTGEPIRRVIWCDIETGEIERYAEDDRRTPYLGDDGKPVTIRETRRIGFEPKEAVDA